MSAGREATVVIIGAGFSGAATAAQLLRQAAGSRLRIVLINESGRMARGLAYGTHSSQHVLNVPAGNMSALAEDADHFVRYCRWSDPAVAPGDFVARRFYGAYLEAMLGAAEYGRDTSVVLERVVGQVLAIRVPRGRSGASVELSDGRLIEADHVVVAFGHFAPLDPLPRGVSAALGPRYVADPWRPGALAAIGPDDDVLLLGTGLTAVDVTLVLASGQRRGHVMAVSRRGLRPQAHREAGFVHASIDVAALRARIGTSLRGQVRAFRQALSEHLAGGGDWRDMVGALRSFTPALWQGWSRSERSRFVRHLRPYWETARHRCAPSAHEAFERLQQAGSLQLMAARVIDARLGEGGVDLALRHRGSATVRNDRVQHVVNCTGPSSQLERAGSPLVRGLLADGLIRPDALGLGLQVDADAALLDAEGRAPTVLSYVGPLLKARDWEATAVPELRVHAQRLARRLTRELRIARTGGADDPH